MRMRKTFIFYDSDLNHNGETEPLLQDHETDNWQVFLSHSYYYKMQSVVINMATLTEKIKFSIAFIIFWKYNSIDTVDNT